MAGARVLVAAVLLASLMCSHSSVISSSSGGHGQKELSNEDALSYLDHYGYLSIASSVGNFSLFESFEDSLRSFQKYFGLSPSGVLDSETSRAMKQPRCGVRDIGDIETASEAVEVGLGSPSSPPTSGRRVKRLSVFDSWFLRDMLGVLGHGRALGPLHGPSSRWRSLDLTYRVSKYPEPGKLSRQLVDAEISAAFALWSEVTDLSFTARSYGPVHIDIRFEQREHGDKEPFDGEGGVLAHTFYPLHGGDVHFDGEEDWVESPGWWGRGTHFRLVAAHELGHALGLPHISDSSALMFPTIDDRRVYEVKLAEADVEAIQRLYGPRTRPSSATPPRTSTPTTTTTEDTFSLWRRFMPDTENKTRREKEKAGSGSAVCSGQHRVKLLGVEGAAYLVLMDPAVTDHQVWRLAEDGGLASASPLGTVASLWPGMQRTPDAGFTWTNGLTYFFSGSKYYRYTNRTLDPGFPRRLKKGFSGVPPYLDAAILSRNQTRINFIKNSRYWTFSPSNSPPLEGSAKLSNGISDVVSGIQFNNKVYLFGAEKYWRLDSEFAVDTAARPPYPRYIRDWWFGCSDSDSD